MLIILLMTFRDENFIWLQSCFWKLNVEGSSNRGLLNIKKQEKIFSSAIDVASFLPGSWQKTRCQTLKEMTFDNFFTSNLCPAVRVDSFALTNPYLHNEKNEVFLERWVSTATGAVRQKRIFRKREQSPCSHECPYKGRPDRLAGWKNRALFLPVRWIHSSVWRPGER